MQKLNIFKYLLILAGLLLLASMAASCKSSNMPENPVNNNVLSFRDFSLDAASVGQTTSVTGTIFVKGDKQKPDVRHIQITAQVEVDPQDWGGVAFYPSAGWKVTSVASDYPQGNLAPESYVTTLSSGDAFQVHIGNSKFSEGGGGGKGSVVIELDPVSSANALPQDLEIVVAVGSKGDLVFNSVSQKISVPLNVNYRTPSRPPAPTNIKVGSLTAGIGGQTTPLNPNLPEFAQISGEALSFIGGVDSQLTRMLSVEDIRNIKQTTDYLEIGFDPSAQITTSQIRNHQWESVTLSSAIFFLGGEYYGLAAWPDANGPDRYLIYGSTVPIKPLEQLVKNAATSASNSIGSFPVSREQAIARTSESLRPSIVARADIKTEVHGWYWEVTFDNLNALAAELMPFPLMPPDVPGQYDPDPYPGIWQSVIATVDTHPVNSMSPISMGAYHSPRPGPYVSQPAAITSARDFVSQRMTDVSWVPNATVEAYLRVDTWIVLLWDQASVKRRIKVSVDAVSGLPGGASRGYEGTLGVNGGVQ